AFFSIAGQVLARFARGPGIEATIKNLNARIRSWWAMVAIVLVALVLGRAATLIVFALLFFLAFREFITLTPTRLGDHRTLFLAFFVVIPLQYWIIGINWYGLFAVFIPVYVFVMLPAVSVITGDTKDFLARSAKVQWGLLLA